MPAQILTILIALMIAPMGVLAQNITVINQYGDTTGLGSGTQFQLTDSQQHTIIINYYEPATIEAESRLQQLLGGALEFYIDESVKIEHDEVFFWKGRNTVFKEMTQIVEDGIKFYKYKEVAKFDGFSDRVEVALREIEGLNLDNRSWDNLSTDEREQFQFHLVQKHLNDLKHIVNQEIGNFGEDNLMVMTGSESQVLDPELQAELLEELSNFETHDPLESIEFNLSDATITFLASADEFILPDYSATTPEASDDFAQRVFSMLEQNNSKLDRMQIEMDDMRRQQEADRIEAQDRRDAEMQGQINDLRTMIVELVNDRRTELPVSGGVTPSAVIPNLPQSVDMNFTKGGTSISLTNKFILNEVVDLLARHPSLKVMVTGYADKSGNAQSNLLLSQKRSRSVRNFILNSGLGSERVIMNYFGDRDSQGVNAEDRRVVIDFLLN